MRITVECGGFTRAADACLTANQTAAVLTESLAAHLSGTAGMAGNDATSSDFARPYDSGAAEALAALADLTHAFVGAGRLLARTGDNHARAESAAARRPVLGYDGGSLHDGAYVRVQVDAPPSSLGPQEPSLGTVDRWILDQVEGFVWPSADTGLLRTAGSAWRRTAASTAGVADHLDAAVALVEQQRSPEVPLAVDALGDLTTIVGDTAWQLGNLATACEDYADAVAAARERTRALLDEVARMVVEGAALSVVVAGLSGGLGGGATLAAAIARVRAVAPRFYAVLVAVRTAASTAAGRVERAAEELAALRARVERFLRIPERGEVGELKHPLGWAAGRGSERQLQKKFKHAPVFGVDGPYNAVNSRRFENALREFVESDLVTTKVGTMRGQPGTIVFHYDPSTRRCVVTSKDGDFISGWKLSPSQLAGVIEKGHLGGS